MNPLPDPCCVATGEVVEVRKDLVRIRLSWPDAAISASQCTANATPDGMMVDLPLVDIADARAWGACLGEFVRIHVEPKRISLGSVLASLPPRP